MMTPSVSVVTQIQLGVTGGMMMMPVVGETRVMWTKMAMVNVLIVTLVEVVETTHSAVGTPDYQKLDIAGVGLTQY